MNTLYYILGILGDGLSISMCGLSIINVHLCVDERLHPTIGDKYIPDWSIILLNVYIQPLATDCCVLFSLSLSPIVNKFEPSITINNKIHHHN